VSYLNRLSTTVKVCLLSERASKQVRVVESFLLLLVCKAFVGDRALGFASSIFITIRYFTVDIFVGSSKIPEGRAIVAEWGSVFFARYIMHNTHSLG
jgi:hypothetical protein